MSGFEFVDEGSEDDLPGMFIKQSFDVSREMFMAWVEEMIAERQRARNRFPREEVEALLESLKTEYGFTKPVKWGK